MWVVLCTNHIFLEINCKNAAFVSENNNFLFRRSKPGTKAQIIRLRSARQLLYHSIPRQRVVIRIDENFSIKKIKTKTVPSPLCSPNYAGRVTPWHRDTSAIWTSMELQTKMGGKLAIPDFISSLLSVLRKLWGCTNIFLFLLNWQSDSVSPVLSRFSH